MEKKEFITKTKERLLGLLPLILLPVFLAAQNPTQTVWLSGTGYNDTKVWDFFCSKGANSGKWTTIRVPSQWEQEGFGEYTYGRWYKQPGKKPSDETGQYKTRFMAPSSWKDKTIKLVFEGVMTDTEVRINDQPAGPLHQGGFYRFSFDISNKILFDTENTLDVMVSKHSADRLVNAAERMADWWLFGGIYRPVYLEILPSTHIAQVKVDARADGSLNTYAKIVGHSLGDELRATVYDPQGKVMGTSLVQTAETTETQLSVQAAGIVPWSPESPALYHLKLELIRRKEVLHTLTERIGFRTIEVRPYDGIYCNGTRIVLKGVNRHTFWPESGRCTSPELSVMDAKLIKEMNMNAVRGHYPPDGHFLDACDSLGIFVIDELAGWQNAYNTEIGTQLVTEMVNRDVNHPCIIIWSNGNEGGWNEAIDPMFSQLDPQKRTVIHPWADFGDIDTHHYPQYQTGVHRFTNGSKIFMPTEFLHSLYDEGAGAGLDDFWGKWKQHPLFAGGFIWAFADDAIRRSDFPDSLDSDGQHAPDGILGPYREKEGSFFTIKEIWAPIQFQPLRIQPNFNGEFFVRNEYTGTNLNQCRMNYRVLRIPGPWEKNKETIILASGPVSLPSIEPGETRKIKMDVPVNFFEGDVLLLTATDPSGMEICTWSWPVRRPKDYLEKKLAFARGTAGWEENETEVILRAAGTQVT
ncbi:MAG TPA: glycoside hydrolase family 2 TIM barrel-domain containing protein, partial [Prolixibacteraceae bacterium]|nr:glycoside hydrolase family 2 TIM barrel-domain containing protein [Prolixibacteraceae bacterium]